jgi:hypothetical protein
MTDKRLFPRISGGCLIERLGFQPFFKIKNNSFHPKTNLQQQRQLNHRHALVRLLSVAREAPVMMLCLLLKDEFAILYLDDPAKQFFQIMIFSRGVNRLPDRQGVIQRQSVAIQLGLQNEAAAVVWQ